MYIIPVILGLAMAMSSARVTTLSTYPQNIRFSYIYYWIVLKLVTLVVYVLFEPLSCVQYVFFNNCHRTSSLKHARRHDVKLVGCVWDVARDFHVTCRLTNFERKFKSSKSGSKIIVRKNDSFNYCVVLYRRTLDFISDIFETLDINSTNKRLQ